MRLPVLALVGFLAAACSAESAPPVAQVEGETAPPRPAAAGETEPVRENAYGTATPDAVPVALAALVADPKAQDGKVVRVEGTVTDVCAKRGCWIRLGAESGPETLLFKVTDGVLVFPMSERGRYAVAEGTVRATTLDLEKSREVLAQRAKAEGREFDPASVTEPVTVVRLDGLHARIRDRR